MKFLTPKFLLVSALLLGTISSQADTVKFSAPAEYCFPQTSIKSEFGKFDKVFLDHNVIIHEKDHFKIGDIFVGFRRKSQPDVIWLTDGVAWTNAAETPIAYPIILPNGDDKLQPIIPTFISNYPIDVSAYTGDDELWVGYGLAPSEAHTNQEIFDEMISSKRLNLI